MSEHTHNDMLAAEYVLGTLRGAARRRFETLMDRDPALAAKVCQWQEAFGFLDDVDTPVQPPERVWRRIQWRLPQSPAARERASGPPSGTEALGPGRKPRSASAAAKRVSRYGWQVASFVLAASLAGVILWPYFRAPNEPGAAPTPVAVLASAQGQGARQIVASLDVESGKLILTPLNLAPTEAGHSLELWLIVKGRKPAPMGLLKADGATVIALNESDAMRAEATLAVSLEPPGGSPTGQPTGAVLYSGKIHGI